MCSNAVTLNEFESDVEALDDLLAWLVEGAVRIKAMLADTAGAMGVAAETWTIAPGIMPPFPEKSSFGDVSGQRMHCCICVCRCGSHIMRSTCLVLLHTQLLCWPAWQHVTAALLGRTECGTCLPLFLPRTLNPRQPLRPALLPAAPCLRTGC